MAFLANSKSVFRMQVAYQMQQGQTSVPTTQVTYQM